MLLTEELATSHASGAGGDGAASEASLQLPCSRCGEILRSRTALHQHYTELCPAKDNSLYGAMIATSCAPGNSYLSPTTTTAMPAAGSAGATTPADRHGTQMHGYEELHLQCGDKISQDDISSSSFDSQKQFTGKTFPCEHCDKVFSDPSNLQRHIRAQHNGARSHTCGECGKTFATSSGLKQHQHIHSSVKPFQCEVCLKAYTQFSNLCRHKRMHADCRQQIKCKDCGQSFSTMTSLSKHKRFCEGVLRGGSRFGFAQSPAAGTSQQHAAAAAAAAAASPSVGMVPDKSTPAPPGAGAVGAGNSALGLSRAAAQAVAQVSSLNAAAYMNLYAPRPTFPFYPPALGHPAFPMFHTSHPALGALHHGMLSPESKFLNNSLLMKSALSPRMHEQSAEMHSPRPKETYDEVKKEEPSNAKSEEGSDVNSEAESIHNELDVSNASDVDLDVDNESEHSVTEEPKQNPLSSSLLKEVKTEPGTKPKLPELHRPYQSVLQSGTTELPLDLSKKSGELEEAGTDEEESPRKTHIFGDEADRKPALPPSPTEEKHTTKRRYDEEIGHYDLTPKKNGLGFPYGMPSPAMMDPIYRVNKDKYQSMQEAARSLYEHRFSLSHSPFSPLAAAAASQLSYYHHPHHPHHQPHNHPSRHHQIHHPVKPYPLMKHHGAHGGDYSHFSSVAQKMKERYSCKFCGKVFPRSANLTRHLRTHTGEQPYKCKYCERSFSISSNLQRHVRNIHNKEKPFKCSLCDRCFGQQTNLDRHLKKHESDGPNVIDSPPSTPANDSQHELEEKEESYFDEIRNFIDKTTGSMIGAGSHHQYPHHPDYTTAYGLGADQMSDKEDDCHINMDDDDDEEDPELSSTRDHVNHNNNLLGDNKRRHLASPEEEEHESSSDQDIDLECEDDEDELINIEEQYPPVPSSQQNTRSMSSMRKTLACS